METATLAQKMTACFPQYGFGWLVLGATLKQMGRNVDALAPMQKATTLLPGDAAAHSNLGNTLKELGRLDEAETSCRRALEIKPDYADAHSNLGAALNKLGRLTEAEASYRRALEIKPDYIEAHNNLGNTLNDLGRLTEAESSYRRALEIKPDYAGAHSNLGNTLKELGRLDEAEASYRRALEIRPDYAEAHSNLGATLKELGRLNEAETSCRLALDIKPDYAEAHNNLGATLRELGRLTEAEASYRRALEIKPDYIKAHNNLGNTLNDLGRLNEAETSCRLALDIKPDYAEAHSNLLFSLNYSFNNNALFSLQEARLYGYKIDKKITSRFTEWLVIKQPERLRIGLVSGDLKSHPVGYFLESLLSQLDLTRVELIAYSSAYKEDELSLRIKPYFSAWKLLLGQNDEAAARLIHADGVHILIDLAGHTAKNRLPVFAWKPAPIQVSWLGYFATTGVTGMDYLIADPWTLPETEERYFTEKIWRLPETRLCFTPPDINVDVTSLPALTNGYITFGCFNNLTKMNDQVVCLWSRVLATVPSSRLILKAKQLKDSSVRELTLKRFAAHGIGADRLILEGPEPRAQYLAAYNRVDIALDPFPYPGGATSVESLWMGVPVITLAGKSFLSRQGVGILMNVGLPEWVAADTDDYVMRVAAHARNLHYLAKLRNGLRQQVLGSPIMDARRFAGHFEAALREMWRVWGEERY